MAPMLAILLTLALTPREQAQHHLYLANGYFLAGEVEAAKREALAAARVDPDAEIRCEGVRVPVRAAGVRIEICGMDRASPPDKVLREVRRALARGDQDTVRRLDPFHPSGRFFLRLLLASPILAASN